MFRKLSGKNTNIQMFHRYDFAIVNRTFWPKSQTLGEGHLLIAEKIAKKNKRVLVIAQKEKDFTKLLKKNNRGKDVSFKLSSVIGDSSSNIAIRLFDTIFFSIWTFIQLCLKRPKKVYVSTDPPIAASFIVFIYSKLFRAKFYYHFQDIHPEITDTIIPLNKLLYKFLLIIDKSVQKSASKILTINSEMKKYLLERAPNSSKINIISNPTIINFNQTYQNKKNGFVFCGNAGRLQRMPLLLLAIEKYIEDGGNLPFKFIGSGVFSKNIFELSQKYSQVECLGYLNANECNNIISNYKWALLPIEDEITKFAFPSKTSAYLIANSNILSICSSYTSVSKWISSNQLGINVEPNKKSLVKIFNKIERNEIHIFNPNRKDLVMDLSPEFFANKIIKACLS